MRNALFVVTAAVVAIALAPVADGLAAGATPEPARDRLEWMTPELQERLLAGEEVHLEEISGFPSEESGPANAPLPYTRIRPGSPLGVSQLACTANFVFENGDRLAIGTAGHCSHEGSTERVLIADPASQTVGLEHLGTTIMSVSGGLGSDFALIEIEAGLHHLVHPAIAEIDGPCGWRGPNSLGDPIQYYGHGIGFGAGGQARTGTIIGSSSDHITYTRAPGGSGGDSGSPVRYVTSDGEVDLAAAGINTHGFIVSPNVAGQGTSAPRIMELIDQADIGSWSLVDSPNCDDLGS